MSLLDVKNAIRKDMKARRANLARLNPTAGEPLAQKLSQFLDETNTWPSLDKIICGYWPIQSEISPFPLMQVFEKRGYRLGLASLKPSAVHDFDLVFQSYALGDPLISGPYGISQPHDDAGEVEPDLVLVPLLAFDAYGTRLGYGGGYYDRVIARLRCTKATQIWGLGYKDQQFERIPREPHDQALDMIFTDNGNYQINTNN